MPRKSKIITYLILQFIGPWLIRLLGYTLRIERVNYETVDRRINERQSFLFCLWHGRMLVPIFVHRNQKIIPMISMHSDGEMITSIVKKLGYGAVRGSSKKGGKQAFDNLLEHLKNGDIGAMLPDGPTGPRHHLKKGTIFLAAQSGVPIIPLTFAAKTYWKLNSWDRFIIPKPFTRCVVYYGDPVTVPEDIPLDEIESRREQLEAVMMDLLRTAENHFGRTDQDV